MMHTVISIVARVFGMGEGSGEGEGGPAAGFEILLRRRPGLGVKHCLR